MTTAGIFDADRDFDENSIMRKIMKRSCIVLAFGLLYQGCSANTTGRSGSSGVPSDSPNSSVPVTAPATTPSPVECSGRKIGTYAWSQNYWRETDTSLLEFLDSSTGRSWACGDLSINVADYSNPDHIHDSNLLVSFIQSYRLKVRNPNAVVWLTYGDVVEKSGAKMSQFTSTFFAWAAAIPKDVATSMGTIGISYDVEHIDPDSTKSTLLLAQQLRGQTNFEPGRILIQHTIEGDPNVVGTEYVMKYADSALAMVYRNYMHDSTGRYSDDSNILNRLLWMLSQQCTHCLDDSYAAANYVAKITVMVEASCQMGAGCGKISLCAFDGDSAGANYMVSLMDQMDKALVSDGHMTQAQYQRLFSTGTPYTTHNWEWYRCYAPFSETFQYPSCSMYHTYAAGCRGQ